ncbi:hypothetical protein ACP4OV_021334 [Aristida adscensionis]
MLTPTSKVLEGVPNHINNRSSAPTFQAIGDKNYDAIM